MNTLICMQGPVITRLTRKIDEYLNMSDSPVTEEARARFLTNVMKVDFTTLQSFRNIDAISGDEELFNAYLEFSNAVLDSWQKSPSFKSVEVLTVDMVNVRIAADVI